MKTKKRDRLEIIFDVLKVISLNPRISPTPLSRKCNLTSAQFANYFEELINKEFIEILEVKKKKKIVLTQKGINFLNEFNKIVGILEDFDIW